MFFSNFAQIVLLSTALALRAGAEPSSPLIVKGDFDIIEGNIAVATSALATADGTSTTDPFIPKASNLLVNTTVPQGTFADLGWIFDTVEDAANGVVLDGFAYNISVFYIPAGGVETSLFSIATGPVLTDFCGFFSGFFLEAVLPSDVLGTYIGRWIVEYGQSTQPYAPVNSTSGCGPLPFTKMKREFVRTWEVVPA